MSKHLMHVLRAMALASPLALLSGCGGGGGDVFATPGTTTTDGTTVTDGTTTPTAPSTAPGSPAAISFTSAEPTTLALQGVAQSGLAQTSVVTFTVVDNAGTPVPNWKVEYTLSTTLGGISLSAPSSLTNSAGIATVSVISGTVATPVSVEAKIISSDGSIYRAQSSELNISTGVPDQNSFSISVSTFNPEGEDYDGVTSEITARLADRFNNPVPDGTVVQFTTSAGSILPRCETKGGACSVVWTSQNPRTTSGGAFAILAFAVGEESFDDVNSNGRFDSADSFNLTTQDIPEPWLDADLNGVYSSGEVFRDFNSDGIWNDKNGLFNGWLCDDPTRCATSPSLFVFDNAHLVMSDSAAAISSSVNPINIISSTTTKGTISAVMEVKGLSNGLIMPAGTTIALSTTQGTIKDGASYTVPNSAASGMYKTQFPFTIEGKGEAGSGNLKVTVTTPKGVVTIQYFTVSESLI